MFKKEDDLVNAFSKKASKLLRQLYEGKSLGRFLIHEFDSQFGIADLVFGVTTEAAKQQVKRRPLNINWVFPLTTLIENETFSSKDFEARFALSQISARKRLMEYETAGFLSRNQNGIYIVSHSYRPVTDMVISIEAKLKDWRRALLQASRYRRFSDYTFVLLDRQFGKPATEHIQQFHTNNVGLILMDKDKFEIVYKPTLNRKKMMEYSLRLNEAIIGHLRESSKSY